LGVLGSVSIASGGGVKVGEAGQRDRAMAFWRPSLPSPQTSPSRDKSWRGFEDSVTKHFGGQTYIHTLGGYVCFAAILRQLSREKNI